MSRANDPVHPNMMEAGLTIREHFAGMAMQGLVVHWNQGDSTHVAQMAVKYADALLAELAKEQP